MTAAMVWPADAGSSKQTASHFSGVEQRSEPSQAGDSTKLPLCDAHFPSIRRLHEVLLQTLPGPHSVQLAALT